MTFDGFSPGRTRDAPVSEKAAGAQLTAIREWDTIPSEGRFAMLGRISQLALIVHGAKETIVINAYLLEQHLPNAQLVMYPMRATERRRSTQTPSSSMRGYS